MTRASDTRDESPSGVLVVDKPAGMTSARVVARVRKVLGGVKVGHTGTLDPMATGVLPLVIGDATKIASFLLADDKRYRAELELGATTDTDDADGAITSERRAAARDVTQQRLEEVLAGFVGDIEQVPPMYSALKREGQRLYQLARAGVVVEREPRNVRIHQLRLLRFASPRVELDVHCSKGTYVRALARDIGECLGVGAHLSALRRTAAGLFDEAAAIPLEEVERLGRHAPRVAMADALAHLPAVLAGDNVRAIAHGQPKAAAELAPNLEEGVLFRFLTESGALLAVAVIRDQRVRYERVFPGAALAETKG